MKRFLNCFRSLQPEEVHGLIAYSVVLVGYTIGMLWIIVRPR